MKIINGSLVCGWRWFICFVLAIVVLVIFSFNKGQPTRWNGFTLDNYADLFKNQQVIDGLLASAGGHHHCLVVGGTGHVDSVCVGSLSQIQR